MKNLAFLLGMVLAMGAAALVVNRALQKTATAAELEEIPTLIEDCFDRIQRIENQLARLRGGAELPG